MVNIIEVEAKDLHCKYQGQSDQQRVYLEINPENDTMTMWFDGEIGNAVPVAVYNGRILRCYFPTNYIPRDPNEFMRVRSEEIDAIISGHSVEWDGSNHVGKLTDEAQETLDKLRDEIECMNDDEGLKIWDAEEWLSGCRMHKRGEGIAYADCGITPDTTDDELNKLAEKLESETTPGECDMIDGVLEYLTAERDMLRDERDEDE